MDFNPHGGIFAKILEASQCGLILPLIEQNILILSPCLDKLSEDTKCSQQDYETF